MIQSGLRSLPIAFILLYPYSGIAQYSESTNQEPERLKVGLSAGYWYSPVWFEGRQNYPDLSVLPGSDPIARLSLLIGLPEGADLITGFGISRRSFRVSVPRSGQEVVVRAAYSSISLPIGFGLTKTFPSRWSLREQFVLETHVLGGSNRPLPSAPNGLSIRTAATPEYRLQFTAAIGGALLYSPPSRIQAGMQFSYHIGLRPTAVEGTVQLLDPDGTRTFTIYSNGDHLEASVSLSLPIAMLVGAKPQQ